MKLFNKRVLVTGGAGFIGSSLVKRLANTGANVHVVDNLWRGQIENLLLVDGSYAIDINEEFHLIDLTCYEKCLALIRDFEYVYHLADVVGGIQYVFSNQSFIYRQNILINTNVLSACVANNIPNYVYLGTACSYPKHLQMNNGISVLSEDQTFPADPESSYGWSKLMGEYEADLAREDRSINVGLLRLHNVYGPGASFEPLNSQVVPSLIRKAILYPDTPFIVWGSGNQYRDFIYIDDVIDAIVLISEHGLNQGVIQIGSEFGTAISELAKMIVQISGKNIKIQYNQTKPEGDKGRVADCRKARKLLKWSPKTGISEGVELTYKWIESQLLDDQSEN